MLIGWCAAALVNVLAASAQTGPLVQWGATFHGQANNQPSLAGPYLAIAGGYQHNLALRHDGSLVQWGSTGGGATNNQPPLAGPYVAIAAGGSFSLALRPDGSLVQWGGTGSGQGNFQPPLAGPYVAIAAGLHHSLALRADGSLVQWGSTVGVTNNQPPLAGPYVAIAAGFYHCLALRADGSLVQWGQTSSDQADNQPALAGPYVAVAAGFAHSLALRPDGSLVQWGQIESNQTLNQPPLIGPYVAIAAGAHHNLVLRPDGSLVQWGRSADGQTLAQPPLTGPYRAIAAGSQHTFTYQGVLAGAQGPVDLRFRLFTTASAGAQVGSSFISSAVTPGDGGVVSVPVSFPGGDFFAPRWMEIAVSPAGSGDFTTLSPRQAITQAPRARFADWAGVAKFATNATNASSAATATNATNATAAQSVPWSGITGVPPSVSGAFSPWVAGSGSAINYAGGAVGIGTGTPFRRMHVTGEGGTSVNGLRLTHGASGVNWDILVGGSGNSFPGGFALAREGNALQGLVITAGDNVGIGTTSPDARLTVNGSASKPGGGSWSTFSDARLKHDITPLEGSLDRLLALRGVSFIYDDPAAINELPGKRIGMVAQDVERVFPDWVQAGPSGYKSLTFRGFEALTVEALRELRAENEVLRRAMAERQAVATLERDRMSREVAELRAELQTLKKHTN
jgi:hypothetical protein